MARSKVSPSVLHQQADKLEGNCNEMKRAIDGLLEAETVLQRAWDSPAQIEFDKSLKQDIDKFYSFIEGVMGFKAALDEDANGYAKTESINAEIASARNV